MPRLDSNTLAMKLKLRTESFLPAVLLCFGTLSFHCLTQLRSISTNFLDVKYTFLPWPLSEQVRESMEPLGVWLLAFLVLLAVLTKLERTAQFSKRSLVCLALTVIVTAAYAATINPYHSTDFYGYLAFGREIAVHGQSPYQVFLNKFPNDPLIANTRYFWTFYPPIYGPLSLLVFAVPSLLGAETLTAMVAGQKIISLSCYFLSALLLWKILKRNNHPLPASALTAVLLNPMMLFLLLSEAHLEVMVLPLLCALLLSCGKPLILRSLIWSAAVLSKFTMIFYAPLLALRLPGESSANNRELIQSCAAAFTKVLLVAVPVIIAFHFAFEGSSLFGKSMFVAAMKEAQLRAAYENMGLFQYLAATLCSALGVLDDSTALVLARELGALLFPIAAAAVCWRIVTSSEAQATQAAGGFLALYAVFLITANYVQPWYYTLLLPAGVVYFTARSDLIWFCVLVSATMYAGVFLRMSSGVELLMPLAILWIGARALPRGGRRIVGWRDASIPLPALGPISCMQRETSNNHI